MIKEFIKTTNHNGRGGHYLCECDFCGKEFIRNKYSIKKVKKHYCSKICFHIIEKGRNINDKQREALKLGRGSGEKNSMWKGGRIKHTGGYIYIYKPKHPNSGDRGYILEHRFIMEQYLGRYLLSEEVVHHINMDRSDNRLENLQLFPSKRKHLDYHLELKII
jgi:hypothetical protein